jgi:type I restriction enzyme S subunit
MIGSIYVGLSKKIELNNRINANLEAMINTIYDYWFVQYDFPNDNEKPYISSGGKMIWNQILKKIIPENWVNGDISSIGEIIGGSTPSTEKPEYFCNEGYAWITPKDLSLNIGNKFITKGEVDVSEKGFKSASLTIMPKGTVLFSSRAPIGYMAISRGPVTTNQGFKSIVPKPGYSTPFVFYKLKNLIPMITSYASGSTFKEASGTIMKMIETDLPPIPLIEKFTGIADPILEKQNKIELENQELKNLRDWLLPMLLNGQVGVSD